jgi:pimeloyl-ACP methyl ester carboxylesterase
MGVLAYAGMLARHGYSLVMMDARGHGISDGAMATYGWKEREDTRAVVDELYRGESPRCLFALGESMGAAIALQSAAIEPRIAGVVAESAFSDLREVSYDYTGLRWSPLLGRTLFRPASMVALHEAEREGGFRAEDVSPEKAVTARVFPVFLIGDLRDHNVPPRHSRAIYRAAAGPKQIWLVPGAGHTGALGVAPEEFERRLMEFFGGIRDARQESHAPRTSFPQSAGDPAGQREARPAVRSPARPVAAARSSAEWVAPAASVP